MVPIESQDDLRKELQALMEAGLVRSNGSLERRGIEVDHDLYPISENHEALEEFHADESEPAAATSSSSGGATAVVRRSTNDTASVSGGNERIDRLESTVRDLRDELDSVRTNFVELEEQFEQLRQQLGG